MQAAEIARAAGAHVMEMRARHAAVRFGDRSQAARLEKLARILDTALAGAVADHARGLAQRDGDLLDAAAHLFADLGALACAADAAAQAAGEHAGRGDRGKRFESSAWAHALAGRCELRTPALEAAMCPLPFSDRERQIVSLVAAGLSNRDIAERLVISVRTVEGHLYRLFTKLGVNSRDQLALLATREPSAVRPLLDGGSGPALGREDDIHPHAG
jgi:DNA-binding NarL/FixJ family response regulator